MDTFQISLRNDLLQVSYNSALLKGSAWFYLQKKYVQLFFTHTKLKNSSSYSMVCAKNWKKQSKTKTKNKEPNDLSAIPRFCVVGLSKKKKKKKKILVILYWFGGKLIENKKTWSRVASWTELPIVWLIIRSDNIFHTEVNGGLAIGLHVIVQRKFGIG